MLIQAKLLSTRLLPDLHFATAESCALFQLAGTRQTVTPFQLLRRIQEDAAGSAVPVSDLLRRCQILATRAGIPELGEWVRHELNGYPADVELPAYRIFHGHALGDFRGAFGSGVNHMPLPAANLPTKFRDWARKAYMRQPIAEIEAIARGDDDHVHFGWPADLVAHVRERFLAHMVLVQAQFIVGKGPFISAVDTVRNRILAFALEAEAFVKPDEEKPTSRESAELRNVFNTHFYGTVGNFAQGNHDVNQVTDNSSGDLVRLLAQVRGLGVSQEEVHKLEAAIVDDGPAERKTLGEKVSGWLGRMVAKGFSGIGTITTGTATEVLPKMIREYYGIGG